MKKYTITDQEWETVLNELQTLEKENQRLTGVIEGMEKAFSLNVVSHRRELLIAYEQYRHSDSYNLADGYEDVIKRFLAINCG